MEKMENVKKIAEITTYEWYIFFRKKLEIYEKYVKSPHLGFSIFQKKMKNFMEKMENVKKIAEITTYEWYIFFRKKLEIYEKYVKSPYLGVSNFLKN